MIKIVSGMLTKVKKHCGNLLKNINLNLSVMINNTIRFTKLNSPWIKKKIICKYLIPLNVLKFDINVFLFSQGYQNYSKGYFNKFSLF